MPEADSGWFLRHRDGMEHGPFRLADIVSAAEAGNIADDTCVRHESHTRGAWITAPRVQPIAVAMSRRGTPEANPTQTPVKRTAPSPSPTNAPSTTSTSSPSGTAGTAPKSAFRRPGNQPPAALPGSAPFRTNRPTESAVSGIAESANASKPTQILRIQSQSFPVPKRFFDAVLTLFDFRFRYFITPWIMKILWGLTVAAALIWLTKLTYEFWIQPSMDAPGPRTADGSPGWVFEPLAGQSIFQSRMFVYAIRSGMTLLLLLCARVAMETTIVFFRVATDISELKQTLPKE